MYVGIGSVFYSVSSLNYALNDNSFVARRSCPEKNNNAKIPNYHDSLKEKGKGKDRRQSR